VSAPYEAPERPDLRLTGTEDVDAAVARAWALLVARGIVG
jgi:adenylylsulfate kinase-like enzyme